MPIKTKIRTLIKDLFLNDFSWRLLSIFLKRIPYTSFLREQVIKEKKQKVIDFHFKDLLIKDGIFKGIKYPKLISSGSAIYPKLLGSYECELTKVFEQFFSEPLTTIIDIGCAEGYYLVGFAKKKASLKMIGVDISEMALSQTKQMLIENQIDLSRISLYKAFNINLIPTGINDRVLIICDCEGYEDEIFKDDLSSAFNNCILLIECHDFIIPNITERLAKALTLTHQIEIIQTVSESTKLNFIPTEMSQLSFNDKLSLLNEGRPTSMNWIYANPHNNNKNFINEFNCVSNDSIKL